MRKSWNYILGEFALHFSHGNHVYKFTVKHRSEEIRFRIKSWKPQKTGIHKAQLPEFRVYLTPPCEPRCLRKECNSGTASHLRGWSGARSQTLWWSHVAKQRTFSPTGRFYTLVPRDHSCYTSSQFITSCSCDWFTGSSRTTEQQQSAHEFTPCTRVRQERRASQSDPLQRPFRPVAVEVYSREHKLTVTAHFWLKTRSTLMRCSGGALSGKVSNKVWSYRSFAHIHWVS